MDEDDFEHLIETLINQPLTSPRIDEFSEAIRINQQITTNIYNIRRYLEIGDLENYNNTIFNTMFNNIFNFNNEIIQDNELIDDELSGFSIRLNKWRKKHHWKFFVDGGTAYDGPQLTGR